MIYQKSQKTVKKKRRSWNKLKKKSLKNIENCIKNRLKEVKLLKKIVKNHKKFGIVDENWLKLLKKKTLKITQNECNINKFFEKMQKTDQKTRGEN